MNKQKRRTVIAGNWKMNLVPSQACAYAAELKEKLKDINGCDIVICVPDTGIYPVGQVVKGSTIKLGAQNVHWEKSGAFTGETSADMLLDSGVEYVVIGHSERRQYFGESDITVNKRVKAAIGSGLKAILCVGELESEYDQGITTEIVSLQTKIALRGVLPEQLANIIIAYEPVWAIGTGKTATADEADRVNGIIRNVIKELYSCEAGDAMTILYGGSMNAKNAAELLKKENVDGGLIGGASLKAEDFSIIINEANL